MSIVEENHYFGSTAEDRNLDSHGCGEAIIRKIMIGAGLSTLIRLAQENISSEDFIAASRNTIEQYIINYLPSEVDKIVFGENHEVLYERQSSAMESIPEEERVAIEYQDLVSMYLQSETT